MGKFTLRHRLISEKYIYILQDEKVCENINEEEFETIIELLSESSLSNTEIEMFFNISLPLIANINGGWIEIVHNLCSQVNDLQNVNK